MAGQDDMQVVTVKLSTEEYALPIQRVKDINRVMEITKMPHMPSFAKGVINLRGEIIPIVDLRERFHLPASPFTDETRFVMIEFRKQVLGVIVDEVSEVLLLPAENVELPPAAAKLEQECVQGLGQIEDRLLILLDIDRIFTDEEIKDINQGRG